MIPKPCIEVQTSPVERPSVPPWFAEAVILSLESIGGIDRHLLDGPSPARRLAALLSRS
ncbi:hypothetical protein [Ktedonosporobacter rubrisoli]|uniref:hypothetical protein n=1 Tax=Ktedonosporobacter rubrisoli TaxID=2509675 RepID=UPI0013EED82A|nr:hypothetical protein [Ktedonosporobacter rubrisoli]